MSWESVQWKDDLWGFLGSYFSEGCNEESVLEIVMATSQDEQYHEKFVEAIKMGIEAATKKDADIIRILEEANLFGLNSTFSDSEFKEAESKLQSIYNQYIGLYSKP
jgi:hypothetical protein